MRDAEVQVRLLGGCPNNANTRIATLEAALDARSGETASLEGALESQGEEHLAT